MDHARPTALISDDDGFFRMALRSILESRLGMAAVVETTSLDEALERLSEQPDITLALFDLAIPGMETPASLGAVREYFPRTRVVVVSGSQRRRDVLAALEAGVHGYVPKGLGVEDVTRALRSVISGMVYVPPSLPDRPPTTGPAIIAEAFAPAPLRSEGLSGLTPRQKEVLELLVEGKSNKEIARALGLGEGTVKVHLAALFRNLKVNSRAAAAAAGARMISGEKLRV